METASNIDVRFKNIILLVCITSGNVCDGGQSNLPLYHLINAERGMISTLNSALMNAIITL